MKHLEQEEIVTYFYGEGTAQWMHTVKEHLSTCSDCDAAMTAFREDAAALGAEVEAEADAASEDVKESGARIWTAIAPTITTEGPAHKKATWRFRVLPQRTIWQMGVAVAALCLLIAGAAFYAGRAWEKRQKELAIATQRQQEHAVVLVVLDRHLERSERLLVALNHPEDADAQTAELLSEAQSLLRENQTCLEVVPTHSPEVTAVLKNLDEMLRGVVASQDTTELPLGQPEFHQDARNLLFEIRVLREQLPNSQVNSSHARQEGTI
jgi:hypothetical protein